MGCLCRHLIPIRDEVKNRKQQDEVKNRKHGPFYAPMGIAFLPFVTSCFGSFGPTATRFLFALANLEFLRH